MNAPEWIHEQLNQSETPVTIMALAPLTNLALLLRKYPEDAERIEEIVMMGGSVHGGNILKYAEFNVYADPHALKEVSESRIPITILPLEQTARSRKRRSEAGRAAEERSHRWRAL